LKRDEEWKEKTSIVETKNAKTKRTRRKPQSQWLNSKRMRRKSTLTHQIISITSATVEVHTTQTQPDRVEIYPDSPSPPAPVGRQKREKGEQRGWSTLRRSGILGLLILPSPSLPTPALPSQNVIIA
jgi:hypothetical protein